MKEHPILFKGEMVCAILSGQKTQTRRTNLKTKYAVGDRLWVRETFIADEFMGCRYRADGKQFWIVNGKKTEREFIVDKWRPSLFMPRWASRILLEITALREERLQGITVHDCLEEGIPHDFDQRDPKGSATRVLAAYKTLWISINGPGSWDENPIVKVISFKRINP